MGLGFLFEKKILARLKKRTIFALTCFVMKISWLRFKSKSWKIDEFVAYN